MNTDEAKEFLSKRGHPKVHLGNIDWVAELLHEYKHSHTFYVKTLQARALLPDTKVNGKWNKKVKRTHNINKLFEMINFTEWRKGLCSGK